MFLYYYLIGKNFFIQTFKANELLYSKAMSLTSICKLFLKDANGRLYYVYIIRV